MIPNVTRGGRTRGLLRYLTRPEQAVKPGEDQRVELHANPRLVAGSERLMAEWAGYDLSPRYNPSAADQIAAWLDQPRLRSGTRVTVRRKDDGGNVLTDERAAPQRVDAHVWHCSLSLHPDEAALSDQQWRTIAEEFVQGMGFDQQRCRWLALRHGASAGGNDHVHVVVQLVGETGRAANVHNDRPRAQENCRQLEQRHGLRPVEGRQAKRGARATSYRQRYRAERQHEQAAQREQASPPSPEPDRELLERAVRQSAAASAAEGEFVRRLRSGGVIVRPRFEAGRDDRVVGYSVALTPAEGKPIVPHAGGKLAKDLTLPRLRATHEWRADDPDAIGEWQRARDGLESSNGPESDPWLRPSPTWDQALAELEALRDAARDLPGASAGERAQLAGTAAAVFHGWASLEGDHQAALRDTAQRLALSAQIRAAEARLAAPLPRPRDAALLLLAAGQPKNRTVQMMALAQLMGGLLDALARAHQAVGELQQARALAHAVAELAPLREELARQRAAEDPAWASEQQALALARRARPPAGARPSPTPPAPSPAPTRPPSQSQSPKRKR